MFVPGSSEARIRSLCLRELLGRAGIVEVLTFDRYALSKKCGLAGTYTCRPGSGPLVSLQFSIGVACVYITHESSCKQGIYHLVWGGTQTKRSLTM